MTYLPKSRQSEVVVQTFDKELLIYDLKTHKAFQLNETSMIVFQACGNNLTFEDLQRKHKFTEDLIYLTLDMLGQENLLTGVYRSKFAGVSRREAIRKVGLATMIGLPAIAELTAPTAIMADSICGPGLTSCSGTCQDLSTDANNCGTCGRACGINQVCRSSSCTCAAGFTNCGGNCVNRQTDTNNCGGCGNICPGPQAGGSYICSNGTCTLSCNPGYTNCSGVCRNLQTDNNNCGTCGRVCAGGQVCSGGSCPTP